jgi:hypothetical protein
VFGKYFGTLAIWEVIVGHRDIYYAKKIKYFESVELRILVEKRNIRSVIDK